MPVALRFIESIFLGHMCIGYSTSEHFRNRRERTLGITLPAVLRQHRQQVTSEVPQGINIRRYSDAPPDQGHCGRISNIRGHRLMHSIPYRLSAIICV
jgi:hypothetical protein